MNQENQTNNQFIYDLYDNIGRAKRALTNILETIEERTEEEDITDLQKEAITIEITIEEIASNILDISYIDISYISDSSHRKCNELMSSIQSELEHSLMLSLPYEAEGLNKMSVEYVRYANSIDEIIDLYKEDKDITKSEHYNNVLHFLVKKIYIRGQ